MIDVNQLSEQELVELNHKIVARLRFLRQAQTHTQMLDYRIGERVSFRPAGRPEVVGTLTRYNRKSVTVITEAGEHWNVHPGLLQKAVPQAVNNRSTGTPVVVFPESGGRKRHH